MTEIKIQKIKHPTTSEIILSKNHTLYITLYHTTNTALIQGSQKSIRADKESPILKAVLLHKREHNMPIDEAYHGIIGINSPPP